jgi:O-glycosyl hydrolase
MDGSGNQHQKRFVTEQLNVQRKKINRESQVWSTPWKAVQHTKAVAFTRPTLPEGP